jgi:transposase-like protein
VLTGIGNRGGEHVCILLFDGLTGRPGSINTAWPLATVQTCMIRNTFRFTSRCYWEGMGRDLRSVYAGTEAAAVERFREFNAKWDHPYTAISKLWQNAWGEFVPFLDWEVDFRRIICSTNAIEPLNARYRHPVRAEVPLPRDPLASPDRTGQGTLGNEWTRTQRVRDRLQRPNQPKTARPDPSFIGYTLHRI